MTQSPNASFTPYKATEIFNKIKYLALEQQTHPLVVFDLDSTLFDVSPRLEKVLIDIASEPVIQENFPNVIPHFKNIKTERRDWGFVDVLKRAGVDHNHEDLFHTVKGLWTQKFFSNEYIHYDVPYQGSIEFVQKINALHIPIAYLTGRDYRRMETGSREVLQKWKFPLNDQNSQLIMKPHQGIDDALFKRDWVQDIKNKTGKSLFLFENEPVNINIIARTFPDVELVFIDSTHSRKETPPEEIFTLIHFLMDDEA